MRNLEKQQPSTASAYLERINLVIDHITSHLSDPLPLKELSRRAMISPFHFHRVFQGVVGETPHEFIKRLRLERSLQLMSRPWKPVSLTSIALDCGFSSSSDFSRSFRQRFGVAPRAFDLAAWKQEHADAFEKVVSGPDVARVRLPGRENPDGFRVKIRELKARTVAYIRVLRPYVDNRAYLATMRLLAWAEKRGVDDEQWLGYQWESPELTDLDDCRYHIAVETSKFEPRGEVGKFRFPAMTVAEVEVSGDIWKELRALRWLYGVWLPRSGCVPADQPCFEAWNGRPFAHGNEHFELRIQLPIERLR